MRIYGVMLEEWGLRTFLILVKLLIGSSDNGFVHILVSILAFVLKEGFLAAFLSLFSTLLQFISLMKNFS